MNIAIYETVHLECLLPLCELLWDSDYNVHIFTSESFKADLKEVLREKFDCFTWILLPPSAGWLQHHRLLRSFFSSEKFHLILLNSLESRHLLLFWALLPQKNRNVVLNLHDINNFFNSRLTKNIKANLRTVSKKLLNLTITAFAVNAQEMKVHIERNSFTTKPVFRLPHVITQAQPPVSPVIDMVITIPGSIDEKRRDYKWALNAFEMIHQQQLQLRLVLAGRPVGEYGAAILQKCKQLQQEGKNVVYFEHEIKETTFQSLLSESTFIFSPTRIDTMLQDNITEQYGVSKYSGNIYDALRHGKIFIAPAELAVPEEMKSSTLFYRSKDGLVNQLAELINNPETLFGWQTKAYQNAMKFTKENYNQRFQALLHQR